jgi:hypothetical protein
MGEMESAAVVEELLVRIGADNHGKQIETRSDDLRRLGTNHRNRTYHRHREDLINASSSPAMRVPDAKVFFRQRRGRAPASANLHERPRLHRNAYTAGVPTCMAICDGRKGDSSAR